MTGGNSWPRPLSPYECTSECRHSCMQAHMNIHHIHGKNICVPVPDSQFIMNTYIRSQLGLISIALELWGKPKSPIKERSIILPHHVGFSAVWWGMCCVSSASRTERVLKITSLGTKAKKLNYLSEREKYILVIYSEGAFQYSRQERFFQGFPSRSHVLSKSSSQGPRKAQALKVNHGPPSVYT